MHDSIGAIRFRFRKYVLPSPNLADTIVWLFRFKCFSKSLNLFVMSINSIFYCLMFNFRLQNYYISSDLPNHSAIFLHFSPILCVKPTFFHKKRRSPALISYFIVTPIFALYKAKPLSFLS